MLEQILAKLGLKSIDDLKPAERQTWLQWSAILGSSNFTIDDLKKFLPLELERGNAELRNHENSAQKDAYYKAYTDILDKLTKLISGPEKKREELRAFLKSKYNLE